MQGAGKKIGLGLALSVWGAVLPALAEEAVLLPEMKMADPVVVSASKLASPLSQVGGSVTVITARDIEEHGFQTVAEALNLVPGLDVVSNGGPGQMASVFIRGADSGRTLVMVNGVEANDAIDPGRAADLLANLTTDNVERIEILRGPESAVFGSGAMGGVINVITRKGTKSWQGAAELSGGKYTTWNAAASASGMVSNWDASLGTSWNYSAGFPAMKSVPAQPVPDQDPDGYRNWTVDAGAGGPLTPEGTLRLSGRSVQGYTQLMDADINGVPKENSDFSVRFQQQLAHLETDWKLNSWWRQIISAGMSQEDRYYREVPQPSAAEYDTNYWGQNLNLDWHNQMDFPVIGSALAAGVNYRQERGFVQDPLYGDFPERSNHQFGYYVEDRLQQGGFTLDANARWDFHSQFGACFTYRLAPVFAMEQTGTSLKGTWGTGFNAPSLYQLYAPFYGRTDLQPEKSTGWDAGLEQKISIHYKIGATYFQNDFTNQIEFGSLYQYLNLSKTQTKGWEGFAVAEPMPDLVFRLGYTKLTANDLTQAEAPLPLRRRADYKFTLDAGYHWQGVGLQISVQRVGPRWDQDAAAERVVLAPYTLLNLSAVYAVNSALEINLHLNNLGNADYSEAFGYATPGFSAIGGVKYRWL